MLMQIIIIDSCRSIMDTLISRRVSKLQLHSLEGLSSTHLIHIAKALRLKDGRGVNDHAATATVAMQVATKAAKRKVSTRLNKERHKRQIIIIEIKAEEATLRVDTKVERVH